MSRYKGRTDPKDIEKTYPHIVEMIVPSGGFGKRLNHMYDFHAHNSLRARDAHRSVTPAQPYFSRSSSNNSCLLENSR
jgi:hypothetical protein